MKKAQTEIIGVVFIVIILVIAGVFMIVLRLNTDNELADSYIDPELAQSFLNTLMNTKTEKNVIVSDIIRDCYSSRNDLCGGSADCCEYAKNTMINALDATLGTWGRSYTLTVRRIEEKRFADIPENSACDEFAEKDQPGFYYIPPSPPIVVRLDICK